MEIKRINSYSDNRFHQDILNRHTAFLVNDKDPYEIKIIDKHKAIISGKDPSNYLKVIEEFRYNCGHTTTFLDTQNNIIKTYPKVELFKIAIEEIEPSQFYIDEDKLKAVETFVNNEDDIIIPIVHKDNHYISIDGHTRLKAALNKNIKYVYYYLSDEEEYLSYFYNEAKKRNIYHIKDMQVISRNEYEIKWNKFCDNYFSNK